MNTTMIYTLLAYLVAMTHFGFVAFVIIGGVLLYRWHWIPWLHVPCVIYAVVIMVVGWRCPLTDLEINLRERAGEAVHWNEFLHHYIWSHIGLSGGEWFILVGLMTSILLFNWQPYRSLLG